MRRLRYALRCDDAQTSRFIQLGGGTTTTAQAARFRAKETEDEFTPCDAEVVAQFLDGLILEKRGPKQSNEPTTTNPWPDRSKNKQAAAATPEKMEAEQMDNNVVLKQLRIALSLRSDDVHAILVDGGSAMSASEAGALFRKPDARNYRKCGDQVLRQFIAGLVKRRQQES